MISRIAQVGFAAAVLLTTACEGLDKSLLSASAFDAFTFEPSALRDADPAPAPTP